MTRSTSRVLFYTALIFVCLTSVGCKQIESPCTVIPPEEPQCSLGGSETQACNFQPANYSVLTIPKIGGEPANITVNFALLAITSVRETELDMDVTFFLEVAWFDCRLTKDVHRPVAISEAEIRKFWQPDLHFRNTKNWRMFNRVLERPNYNIHPGKMIVRNDRYMANVICSFDFRNYPFDRQQCALELESYRPEMEVLLHLLEVKFDEKMPQLPQFEVLSIYGVNCGLVPWTLGYFQDSYSCVGFSVLLRRRWNYFLWQIYFPSIILVFIAWMGFWIDTSMVPGRVALGITTLLTLCTQFVSLQGSLPPVSYLKAVDVWMFSCMVFVFLSLVEFVIAYCWETTSTNSIFECKEGKRRRSKDVAWERVSRIHTPISWTGVSIEDGLCHAESNKNTPATWREGKVPQVLTIVGEKVTKESSTQTELLPARKVRNLVDQYALVIYVACFIIFSVVYWSVYLM